VTFADEQQDSALKNKKQAARYLNVSGATLERLMRSGLPYVKFPGVAGAVRFQIDDLAEFVAARRVRSGGTA